MVSISVPRKREWEEEEGGRMDGFGGMLGQEWNVGLVILRCIEATGLLAPR
jgi:hypothetical protein